MDISNILAIISLVISLITAIWTILYSKKINNINLKSYYFNEIYREHLVKNIPKARKYISIDHNNRVVGQTYMINEMKNLQNDSLYYKYSDEEYYIELKKMTQDIEDFLISSRGQPYVGDQQEIFYKTLKSKLSSLYSILNEQYLK